eukprot:2449995-Prymnesium_polylepis.1
MPPMELASDEEGTVSDGLSVELEMDGGMGRWMEPMQSRLTPEEDMIEEETSGPPESLAVAGGAAEDKSQVLTSVLRWQARSWCPLS